MTQRPRAPQRRRRRALWLIVLPSLLLVINVPPAIALIKQLRHYLLINSPEYQAQHGRWDVVELPEHLAVNGIHAALLPTGKVLIIAGSGNDQQQFDAGTFATLLYDPASGQSRLVPTPDDLFCAGHAFLADGHLLVAGGTARYELLEGGVTHAAGAMIVKNEFPDAGRRFEQGTEFVAPDGRRYRATAAFEVPPAQKRTPRRGPVKVTASETKVFVEAVEQGPAGVTDQPAQYAIAGLEGDDAQNLYGLAQSMTLAKQDFQGIDDAFEFDPFAEEYVRVADMAHARWYPTLTGLSDGRVLAVSGLDETGTILAGQNEVYDPEKKSWTEREDLFRYFPTYPALFQTSVPDRLFYSGSNAGYGPDDQGRVPGFWDLEDNTFVEVPGLRDPDLLETSASTWVGPVQDQRMIVVGGGGVGESPLSTTRVDLIDLDEPEPRFVPGPDLPHPVRYPNTVQLPDDTVLISNGSRDYRGKGDSDVLAASLYHPDTNTLTPAAAPTIGRNYHGAALLLPNGQVLTLGGDSLFKDAANTKDGEFEKRLEIYTPPYLLRGMPQPVIGEASGEVERGEALRVSTPDADRIAAARLVRPGAATHVTDVEQRSVALKITRVDDALELAVPEEATMVPPGFYMLFLVDRAGTPSAASWVRVSDGPERRNTR